MMKAILTENDGGLVLVLGLTRKNVEMLKQDLPIVSDLSELGVGLSGTLVINAVQPDGSMALPEPALENFFTLSFSCEGLDRLLNMRDVAHVEVCDPIFRGKIVIFAGENEHSIGETFLSKFPLKEESVVKGSTCGDCGSARREDGTCDCDGSLH